MSRTHRTPTGRETSRSVPSTADRWSTRKVVRATLLAALVAVAGGLAGAQIQANAVRESTKQQIDQAKAEAEQVRRAQQDPQLRSAYSAFITQSRQAMRDVRTGSAEYERCLYDDVTAAQAVADIRPYLDKVRQYAMQSCSTTGNRYPSADELVGDGLNRVKKVGSQAAVDAAQEVGQEFYYLDEARADVDERFKTYSPAAVDESPRPSCPDPEKIQFGTPFDLPTPIASAMGYRLAAGTPLCIVAPAIGVDSPDVVSSKNEPAATALSRFLEIACAELTGRESDCTGLDNFLVPSDPLPSSSPGPSISVPFP